MYINKNSPIPVYHQLKNIIIEKIKNGEYNTKNPIPSEREFSEIFGISRMTVRQALNKLVLEGIIYREKGRGTFVTGIKIEQRNIMSFSDIVREKGMNPVTRVLGFKKEPAGQKLAGFLDINQSDVIYTVKRLRLADDIPVGIEEVFIPVRICPGLESQDMTLSLYKLVKDQYDHVIDYVDNEIESKKPLKSEKELLGIKTSISLIGITSIYYSDSGTKLFFEKSVYRSDEYKYSVRVYVNDGNSP